MATWYGLRRVGVGRSRAGAAREKEEPRPIVDGASGVGLDRSYRLVKGGNGEMHASGVDGIASAGR